MKLIKSTKQLFECETCGKKSEFEGAIITCEKRHKCKHLNIEYRLVETGEYYDVIGIEKVCKNCGKMIDDVYNKNLKSQTSLSKVFKIIKLNKWN